MPFDPHDRADLLQHFAVHCKDIGAATPEDYERMADRFMTHRAVVFPLHECVRANGMVCRYDSETQEYGVKYSSGYIATYFIPVPAGHLPPDKRPPGTHGFRTNMDYYRDGCKR